MKTYYTSDLHFSHRNVIPYCNRPYPDVVQMNEALIKIWNDTVTNEDRVYVVGDFALNDKYALQYGPILNGKEKILICGNHDGCWDYDNRPKGMKQKKKYEDAGWIVKMEEYKTVLDKQLRIAHMPPNSNIGAEYDTRYISHRPPFNPDMLYIHGHLHCRYRKYKNMVDVGIDGDFKLFTEEEVIELFKDEREFIPSPITQFYIDNGVISKQKD